MKKLFRSRTFLGALAIGISLLICFVVFPLINTAASEKVTIIRATKEITKGTQITSDMIHTVEVGGYNLPSNVIKTGSDVIGKYADASLQPGDYILATKISAKAPDIGLSSLDGTKQAVSFSIKDSEDGLSGKLETGDIISLYAADYGDLKETKKPPELQYVKLLAATTSKGIDSSGNKSKKSDDSSDDDMPSTLTVLASPLQAEKIVDYDHNGTLHAALVYRGSEANASKFLKMENQYLAKEQDSNSTTGGDSNGK